MKNSPRYVFALFLAISLVLGACNPAPPQPVLSTSTQPPNPTATIAPSTTPTMPPATATATPVPTPTVTATIAPSPTPAGFYRNDSTGFSFVLPLNWQLLEEDSTHVTFADSSSGVGFLASSEPEPEESSADVFANLLVEQLADQHPITETLATLTLGDNGNVKQVQVSIPADSRKFVWRIAYLYSNNTSYTFILFGFSDILDTRQQTIQKVYSSVQVFRPQPYGLPHDETLYQLGRVPEVQELDPALTTNSAQDFVGLLFAGLVRLSNNLTIEGDLAEDWTISPDGLVYTFHLREGLKFSSGQPLTAQDVKDSWERAADPKTASPTVSTYLGDINGIKEKLSGEAKTISGVTVVDANTLQVTLDAPKPYFLAKLTYPTSFVVDPSSIERSPKKWMIEDNASGPYLIKEIKPDEAVILVRNENYWNQPSIHYLAFNAAPGGSPISLYQAGSIDILPLWGDLINQARQEDDPLHAEWYSTTSLCTDYLQFDNRQPPMDDRNVRLAFALATDKSTLAERLTQGNDLVAETLLPPAIPGFSPNHPIYSYDPVAAKDALKESGYNGKMPAITITASGSGSDERDDVNALVDMWKKNLGITVQVEYIDSANFIQDARQHHGQIILNGWCADYPDPQNFLDVLFRSTSEFNTAGYQDEEVDVMLEQASTTLNPDDRIKGYQQIEERLLSDVALIPLINPVINVLVKARVQNYTISPMHTSYVQLLSLAPENK